MIDPQDVEDALNAQLNSPSLGYPIAWPNKDFSAARPRLEVDYSGGDAEGGTLKGGGANMRVSGLMTVSVVTDLGGDSGTDTANGIAALVAARFTEGLRLPLDGGGTVLVTKPASIRKGFPGEGDWRVPVVVNWLAGT